MNQINLLDLDIINKLPKNKIKDLKLYPVYAESNSIFCVGNLNTDDTNYLKFLYNKEIILKKCGSNELEKIKDSILLNETVYKIEEQIIEKAISLKSSDIHFEPFQDSIKVRFRINGDLITFFKIRNDKYKEMLSRIKIKGNMDMTEKRLPQDGKFKYDFTDITYSIRVSTLPLVYGEKIVLRILYKNYNYTIEGLNLEEKQNENLYKIINSKRGIVLVNGPTGSGKSSTLYTILESIKDTNTNITTIEDPVEVLIENINQISLDRKAGLNFSNGLRSILRQDPDILMVGEIRDEETAKIAVRAAITGHKVYTTIHTKSSKEVYYRLEEMGVEKYLIKDAIIGLISQRLIKVLCNNCKVKQRIAFQNRDMEVYASKGCESCNFTGNSGRKLISAVHYIDYFMTEEKLNELSNKQMVDMVLTLLKKGEISIEIYEDFIKGEYII
ncbi:GspE/PulE family protein [Clostridium chrysemydis]|uniref:GspE/PulE family protein n=1 Tax=Clostridium chrysemydis TaxID=2665504 RepID=UPI001EE61746|nr:GspE/PulE family protein [Clostridium chrysemydis]